jgi:hypothetical protein
MKKEGTMIPRLALLLLLSLSGCQQPGPSHVTVEQPQPDMKDTLFMPDAPKKPPVPPPPPEQPERQWFF